MVAHEGIRIGIFSKLIENIIHDTGAHKVRVNNTLITSHRREQHLQKLSVMISYFHFCFTITQTKSQ